MKNLSLFLFFCCFYITQQSNGQTIFKYYIYLNDSSSRPLFVDQGNYQVYAGTDESYQTFFSNYNIIYFQKAFPATDWENFSRVLYLTTESNTLADDLLLNYPLIFIRYDDLTNEVIELSSDNDVFLNNDNIVIYPNPCTTNILKVDGVKDNTTYKISNILGQQIAFGTIVNKTISLALIESGTYFLELKLNNKKIVKKFIKN